MSGKGKKAATPCAALPWGPSLSLLLLAGSTSCVLWHLWKPGPSSCCLGELGVRWRDFLLKSSNLSYKTITCHYRADCLTAVFQPSCSLHPVLEIFPSVQYWFQLEPVFWFPLPLCLAFKWLRLWINKSLGTLPVPPLCCLVFLLVFSLSPKPQLYAASSLLEKTRHFPCSSSAFPNGLQILVNVLVCSCDSH